MVMPSNTFAKCANDMYYLTVISGPVMVKYSVNCESQWRSITQTCSCGRREADYQKPSHPLAAHMLTAHPQATAVLEIK